MENELSCSNYGSMLEMSNEQLTNSYFHTNWDNSNDHNDPFESALSSMVSSPSTTPTPTSSRLSTGGGMMIKELIGRLGSICDSSNNDQILPNYNTTNNINSCYSTPLNSPPSSKFNLNPNHKYYGTYPSNVGSFNNNYGGISLKKCENNGDSREGSSITGQNVSVELKCKSQSYSNSKKRKSIPKGKVKDISQCPPSIIDDKVELENEESNTKKSKVENEEIKRENAGEYNRNKDKKTNNNINNNDSNNENKEVEKAEPPKDYIHVRARRGQATDSHSLAERVRREKISERMKFLQDLVPNCNKVTGKATVLDEIINYVQSLQRQVEFLSMKLSTVNPTREFNMEALFSKDMFQSRGSPLSQSMYSMDQNSVQAFPFGYQSTQHMSMSLSNGAPNMIENSFSVNPMSATTIRQNPSVSLPSNDVFDSISQQLPTLWEDDLQSIIQMGIVPNQSQGTLPNPQ